MPFNLHTNDTITVAQLSGYNVPQFEAYMKHGIKCNIDWARTRLKNYNSYKVHSHRRSMGQLPSNCLLPQQNLFDFFDFICDYPRMSQVGVQTKKFLSLRIAALFYTLTLKMVAPPMIGWLVEYQYTLSISVTNLVIVLKNFGCPQSA